MILQTLRAWLRPHRLRVATFNCALSRPKRGALARELGLGSAAARKAAAIIQHLRPDVLLLNEFDYDRRRRAARLFQSHYLGRTQGQDPALTYPYVFAAPVNTGVPSGFDLDGDGISGPADALGFGHYPGHYGMLLLSRYPLCHDRLRTFRLFRWRDMPGALLPINPATEQSWYPEALLDRLPLSSKSHWDVPLRIGRHCLHVLASHPTPPVFDGPERRNVKRNHDEIRFWADYVANADYIYDDIGNRGGLDPRALFVALGDLNADPEFGDGWPGAASQLLDHPRISKHAPPRSQGAAVGPAEQPRRPDVSAATADFGRTGRLRVDYVLPAAGLKTKDSGVFWPSPKEPLAELVTRPSASDHRLVWMDLELPRLSGQ